MYVDFLQSSLLEKEGEIKEGRINEEIPIKSMILSFDI